MSNIPKGALLLLDDDGTYQLILAVAGFEAKHGYMVYRDSRDLATIKKWDIRFFNQEFIGSPYKDLGPHASREMMYSLEEDCIILTSDEVFPRRNQYGDVYP